MSSTQDTEVRYSTRLDLHVQLSVVSVLMVLQATAIDNAANWRDI
jgi:hypothetical protein